jgi:hypothetical protein
MCPRNYILKEGKCLSIVLIIAAIALTCLLPDKAFPEEGTWIGHMTIHLSGSYEKTIDKSHKSKKDIEGNKYNLSHGVYIQACIGSEGVWSQGTGTYDQSTETKHEVENDHELCLDERARPDRTVRPGDSEEHTFKSSAHKLADEQSTVNLHITDDGSYVLIFAGAVGYEIRYEGKTIVKDACSGTEKTLGGEPRTHQAAAPLSWIAEGMVSGHVISGEGHKSYKEWINDVKAEVPFTLAATWFLTDDACEYVRNELEAAKKARDLYLKVLEEVRRKRISGDEFNRLVLGEAGPTSSPMGTNPHTCSWIPGEREDQKKYLDQDDIREKYYRCLPQVIFESDLAHENWHQQTCREQNKCVRRANGSYDCKDSLGYSRHMDDPVNYAMDEVGAYDAKIGILMDWLKENCE